MLVWMLCWRGEGNEETRSLKGIEYSCRSGCGGPCSSHNQLSGELVSEEANRTAVTAILGAREVLDTSGGRIIQNGTDFRARCLTTFAGSFGSVRV
jgi:hypothetical protein